ncbi:hypothetical protein AJ78_03351 [Emergomyces pasteurianus Ep9510]|uniref:CFEM domain-containing protein n=1 Tax=Emergomyces pasteurianus Ep9510 TaxID=1447872 RepID=A0A1J9PJ36_9EURO|nr:hypothetical protein AJ78_03351 [Emergomyces pasteurianus Ep9510]
MLLASRPASNLISSVYRRDEEIIGLGAVFRSKAQRTYHYSICDLVSTSPAWQLHLLIAKLKALRLPLALVACLALRATASQSGVETRAESIFDLPTCAIQCIVQLAPEFPCLLQASSCYCSDVKLSTVVDKCVLGSCTVKESLTAKRISAKACGVPERDREAVIPICGVTGASIAFSTYILRMILKLPCFGEPMHADDWAITVAMVFGIPLGVITVPLANAGLGKDMWNIPFDKITYILKLYYVQEVNYLVTMSVTKVSILFFYLRIFPSHKFKMACYVVMGITIGYGIAFVSAALFQCNPVQLAWYRWAAEHEDYRCSNINLIAWTSAAVEIILDVVVITLPTKQLMGLALSLKKKIHIALMFGVGFFVTAVSIARLKSLLQFGRSANITWSYVPVSYWSIVECYASIVWACMPALRALLRKVSGDRSGASSAGARNYHTNIGTFSSSNGRAISSSGGGQRALRSSFCPHTRCPLGKGGEVGLEELDMFPLMERGEAGRERGFGSCSTIRSDFQWQDGTSGSGASENIGVTGIQDGHGGASEEFSAGSSKFDL